MGVPVEVVEVGEPLLGVGEPPFVGVGYGELPLVGDGEPLLGVGEPPLVEIEGVGAPLFVGVGLGELPLVGDGETLLGVGEPPLLKDGTDVGVGVDVPLLVAGVGDPPLLGVGVVAFTKEQLQSKSNVAL